MDFNELRTPAYVLDERKLKQNLEILADVQERAGCKILLAQKAFSMFCEYPLIGQYLSGTAASGLYEARLGREEMGKETHVFAAAYRSDEMEELAGICDHMIFNSISQLERYRDALKDRKPSVGLRINPECSTQDHAIYDPCAPGSRLGVTRAELDRQARERGQQAISLLRGVEGLHIHTLCEQNADALETTLAAVEEKFGDILPHMRWLNLGGGHHITKESYDRNLLIRLVRDLKEKYDLEIYLEPGEAIALDAGYLVTEVLDVVRSGETQTLILDASAACHMPDVIEMPYRPQVLYRVPCGETPGAAGGDGPWAAEGDSSRQPAGETEEIGNGSWRKAGTAGEGSFTYRLSSCTCLAGDIVGNYSFEREILPGEKLVFTDMAIYTMVKNNTFNGQRLPDIAVMEEGGNCRVQRSFGYEDFRGRLS